MAPITITLTNTDTNNTAQDKICADVSTADSPTDFTINGPVGSSVRWLMPDCFYRNYLVTLTSSFMIYQGNETYTSPLERLGASSPLLTTLNLDTGSFLDPLGAPSQFNWTRDFERFPEASWISITRMSLTGTLPNVWPPAANELVLNDNQLVGDFPETLLSSIPTTLSHIKFRASDNPLNGTFPARLFGTTDLFNLVLAEVELVSTSLKGNFPSFITPIGARLTALTLNWDSNSKLTGSFPGTFVNLLSSGVISSDSTIIISCTACGLTGALELPSASSMANSPSLYLLLSNNALSSISFGTNSAYYLRSMTFMNNPRMTGELGTLFASQSSRLVYLVASKTRLGGDMPDLAGTRLESH